MTNLSKQYVITLCQQNHCALAVNTVEQMQLPGCAASCIMHKSIPRSMHPKAVVFYVSKWHPHKKRNDLVMLVFLHAALSIIQIRSSRLADGCIGFLSLTRVIIQAHKSVTTPSVHLY